MHFSLIPSVVACFVTSALADASITSFPNTLELSSSFDPIIAAYWTGLPHHRRTPFSVSPDGKSAYLAYLDSTLKNVVVQQVDVSTFAAVGTAFTTAGYEAAGLVAQNDGFALMATVDATGTTDLPTDNQHIISLIRYKDGAESWRTPLNGPGVHPDDGLTATPDANGDLVYSEASGLYAAYFVVTAYTGWAAGHFGDAVQYVNDAGAIQDIAQSSTFGCSHNTGIGLEPADEPPFASICAEDHGAIWLNTDTRTMDGVKIANENTTNGVSGEPMGGMSGSYSNLARFGTGSNYIFGWQSRGALALTEDSWRGAPYTQSSPRWLNHNVAIATMSSKNTLTGSEASSVVGAAEGDSQVNWITESTTDAHQNVHVAAISSTVALVTYETLTSPKCEPVPLSCSGTYAGTSFQLVDSTGAKVGSAVVDTKVFVSGDIANVGTDKVCWPYVDMTWDLSGPKSTGALVTKMSFACASTGDAAPSTSQVASSSPVPSSTGVSTSSTAAIVAPTSVAVVEAPVSSSEVAISTSAPVVVESPIPTTSELPASSASDISPEAISTSISSVEASPTSAQPTTFATIPRPSATAPVPAPIEDDECDSD